MFKNLNIAARCAVLGAGLCLLAGLLAVGNGLASDAGEEHGKRIEQVAAFFKEYGSGMEEVLAAMTAGQMF